MARFSDAILRQGRRYPGLGVYTGGALRDPVSAASAGFVLPGVGAPPGFEPAEGDPYDEPIGYTRFDLTALPASARAEIPEGYDEDTVSAPVYNKGDLRRAQREARRDPGREVLVTDEKFLRDPPGQRALQTAGLGTASPADRGRMDPGTRALNMAYRTGPTMGRSPFLPRGPGFGGGAMGGGGMGMQTTPDLGPMTAPDEGGGGFGDAVMRFLSEGENLSGLAQLLGAGANIYGAHQQGQRYEDLREEEREEKERRRSRHESVAPFYAALLRRANAGA